MPSSPAPWPRSAIGFRSRPRAASATTWVGRGLLFVAIVFLLEHARPLLLPVAIAIVFTFVLAAPVRALRRRGVHEYIGAALVIGAVLGVAVLLLMLVAAPAAAWWARAPLIVHELVEALQGWRDALFPYAPPAPLTRAPRGRCRRRPVRRAAGQRGLDLHPPRHRRDDLVRALGVRRR